jgi:nitroreductase
VDVLDAIRARRSIGRLVEPAPSEDELRTILEAAAAAPDHGELRPFRFVVLRDEGADAFGRVLEAAYRARSDGEVDEAVAAKERTKLGRAPMVVVVGAQHQPSRKVPFVEQIAAAAAATQNAMLAATALGYGSMWRTGDPAYDPSVLAALGLGPDDAVVGFLYLGTIGPEAAKPPKQPSLDGLVTVYEG